MNSPPKFTVFKWHADQKVITVKFIYNLCPRCCSLGKKNKIKRKDYQKRNYSSVAYKKDFTRVITHF